MLPTMASKNQQITRLRNQIKRARDSDGERINDAVEAGAALATGAAIGALRGKFADEAGEWNVKGTKIPIELVIGVGALGLSLTRITGDGMANSGILSMGTSALAILTARKTEAAVLEDAAAEG